MYEPDVTGGAYEPVTGIIGAAVYDPEIGGTYEPDTTVYDGTVAVLPTAARVTVIGAGGTDGPGA